MLRQLPNESLAVVYAADYLAGQPNPTPEQRQLFTQAFLGTQAVLGACQQFGFESPANVRYRDIYSHAARILLGGDGTSPFEHACESVRGKRDVSLQDMGLLVEGSGGGPSKELIEAANNAAVDRFLAKPDVPRGLKPKQLIDAATKDLKADYCIGMLAKARRLGSQPSPDAAYLVGRLVALMPRGRYSPLSTSTMRRASEYVGTWAPYARKSLGMIYGGRSPFYRDLIAMPGGEIFTLPDRRGVFTGFKDRPDAV